MGQRVSKDDFEWVYTQEPHATRRREILAKHPEIKRLMGHDPSMAYCVSVLVIWQVLSCWLIARLDVQWPMLLLAAYCIGGVINHALMLAVHEIAHNLAFGHSRPLANRMLGMLANLPIGVPMSVSFKKYHLEHHRYQGIDGVDMDVPSQLETRLFRHSATKLCWLFLQPLFYALRPVALRPKPPTRLEIVNVAAQFSFDSAIAYACGAKALLYLIGGSLLAMGVHPVAGHFVSEHYTFAPGFETYSYYGCLNYVTFNVGYHNEHHDFPNVPGSRLPQVREIAREFYDDLPKHSSWCRVLWDFVFDRDVGPCSRVKRREPRHD